MSIGFAILAVQVVQIRVLESEFQNFRYKFKVKNCNRILEMKDIYFFNLILREICTIGFVSVNSYVIA